MTDRQARLEAVLQALLKEEGMLGASLVSRDGLAVKVAGRHEMNRETFSAMSATLVGAVEIALAELGAGAPQHVVARTPTMSLILVGATTDLLLVAYARGDAAPEALAPKVERAAREVAAIVTG